MELHTLEQGETNFRIRSKYVSPSKVWRAIIEGTMIQQHSHLVLKIIPPIRKGDTLFWALFPQVERGRNKLQNLMELFLKQNAIVIEPNHCTLYEISLIHFLG
jgi:hypothetical protein